MAALGYYDFRDPSLEDYINFEKELLIVQGRGGTKQEFKILQMECTMPSGATMIAADAGRTNEFDGVATPIIVYADSSHANDNGTTPNAGVRSITVFGIDEDDDYNESTILTNGTTKVAGVLKYQRTIATKGATVGASKTAVGTVRVTDTTEAETYLSIPAGQIASAQAGKLYVPTGWKAMILEINAGYVQTADAAAALYVEGANIWVKYDDEVFLQDEIKIFSIDAFEKNVKIKPGMGVITGGDNIMIDIFHQSVDTDVTTHPIRYNVYYLLWKEA